MTLTIEIENNLQKSLERIAFEKGKRVDQFVVEILGDYLGGRTADDHDVTDFMRLSEPAFQEWDNEEDAIYDTL